MRTGIAILVSRLGLTTWNVELARNADQASGDDE
jgi:hypothetical protein